MAVDKAGKLELGYNFILKADVMYALSGGGNRRYNNTDVFIEY